MFDEFRLRMKMQGKTMGEGLKKQSDMIMDATFTRDPAYRRCWLLDKDVIFPEQTLDGYKKAKAVFTGSERYNPKRLKGFKPIDAKYLVHTYTSISSGDAVDYYLQFRPHEHGHNPNVRVGAYVLIPDDLGKYNLWLIVARDDRPQFPQFYILKCNLLLKWNIDEKDWPSYEGKHVDTGTYFSWSVERTQSSYNSGVWQDYLTASVENQLKAWLPTNDDTRTIFYNKHFVISDNPLRRIAWETSKVENTTTWGLTKLTFTQELEYDEVDNLSWINTSSNNYSDTKTGADYDFYKPRSNDENIHSPVDPKSTNSNVISFTGVKSNIKIGGSFKTFTANLYRDGEIVLTKPYWKIEYYNQDVLVCEFNFIYEDDNLVCDNHNDELVVLKNKIVCLDKDGNQSFGIQFEYDLNNSMDLKFKCLPILDMIGGKIILSVGSDPIELSNSPASLTVEVEGL